MGLFSILVKDGQEVRYSEESMGAQCSSYDSAGAITGARWISLLLTCMDVPDIQLLQSQAAAEIIVRSTDSSSIFHLAKLLGEIYMSGFRASRKGVAPK